MEVSETKMSTIELESLTISKKKISHILFNKI